MIAKVRRVEDEICLRLPHLGVLILIQRGCRHAGVCNKAPSPGRVGHASASDRCVFDADRP